jgi:YegS/Rv2252/BmrU family lipid kinase
LNVRAYNPFPQNENPLDGCVSRVAIKGTLFLNPSSGNRMAPSERARMREAFVEAGLEVLEVKSGLPIEAIIREQLDRGRRLFIAAGGDGTINHVVQPLVNTDAMLAVIPVGTYNHFAKDLGIPLAWRDALEVAMRGSTRQIDCGRINERFFVNNVSLGLYPELVMRREEKGREYPRWKARLYAIYATLRKFPHVSFAVETANHREAIRTHLFMVSNNSYDLSRIGVEAPRRTLEEGRLSVYWLPHVPRLALMKFIAHYLRGNVRQAPGFRSFRTRQMKLYSPKSQLRVGMDGEIFEIATPIAITTVPQSLLVKVPRT